MTKRRILVVDDEDLSRDLLIRALTQNHFEACGVSSGALALERLEGGDIDLLILDFVMPEMDGAELCMKVRSLSDATLAATPIVMLTGFSGDDQEIRCLKAGADDFVTKPVNSAVLGARIETHLRLREIRAELEEQNRKLEQSQAEIERDLEAAQLTQQAILPQNNLVVDGWLVSTLYQPVIQVGGDIYDWVLGSNGALYTWISDATGHGASAALMTALAKSLFRNAVAFSQEPTEIIREVNRAFRSVFRGRFLLTAMCTKLDFATGDLEVAGAGHPPAVLMRQAGTAELLESCWPPLGIGEFEEEASHRTVVNSGDHLILWTDGFFGMAREDGTRVGMEEVIGLLQQGFTEENWLLELLAKLRGIWDPEATWPDDLTLLSFKRV